MPPLKVDWPHFAVWLTILAALTAFWVWVAFSLMERFL
jgi:hypothetical protein